MGSETIQQAELRRARQREYSRRPEVKARVKKYYHIHNQIPAIKEHLIKYKHEWYMKRQSELLERSKQYRLNNLERIHIVKKIYWEKRKNHFLNVEKRRLRKIRHELMEILGGEFCKNCGYDIYEALQFDHINGRGCEDRRNFHTGRIMYQFYASNPELARKTLQVLCANCNFIKRHISDGELN